MTTLCESVQDYIDGATRAVAVSWNIYNPNEDIFTVAQVIFVFHPTGHVEPYARLAPLRLMRDFFFTNTAFESLAFSIMIVLVLYFFAKEVFELLAHGPMVYFAEVCDVKSCVPCWKVVLHSTRAAHHISHHSPRYKDTPTNADANTGVQ